MPHLSGSGFLGLPIGRYDMTALLNAAALAVDARRQPFVFACANPHSLVVAEQDADFRAALESCSALVADGVGLTFAAGLAGADVGPRITGTDFFLGTMRQLNRRGGRVFFLGSRNEVLNRIIGRARSEYPNLHVDVLSPPYGEWSDAENETLLQAIEAARPDVLWVGMTAPRQEKWVHRNLHRLNVPVIGSIGAVFDFYAGTVQRAPHWVCAAGLEWLYRLVREPRRLWRRTVLSGPMFLLLVLRYHG